MDGFPEVCLGLGFFGLLPLDGLFLIAHVGAEVTDFVFQLSDLLVVVFFFLRELQLEVFFLLPRLFLQLSVLVGDRVLELLVLCASPERTSH